ncbi:uncharacterized protein F5Z01DRAFT_264410 [Emericellopsis atlantica]|uniref:Extracellular serine-rich protein n=1 Tax=Emericellopsis atlantica TaxID=2614577 RepID=A0A9P7ZGK4_9HYPO|nr:uncharacterized protein F5Z01DRAFT_264410 [Emericellopsis atlantica]KAG9251734.1 hypothetical protein F5Z01DRAFT_264410 [Emericellopsis atlantica]
MLSPLSFYRVTLTLGCLLGLLTPSYAVPGATVDSKVLIFARDSYSASTASSGLEGYGIPFETVLVPKEGITLPALSSSSTEGRYGSIIVMGAVSYDYDGSWNSALTTAQWDQIYQYQTDFHVRLVRTDEYPGPGFGASIASGGGCCASGVEQLISFTNTTSFPTANLKANAGVSTTGLYHYPATITDPDTTWEIAKFGPGGAQTGDTTAGVINNFGGREQLVWFISWATDWSATSNFLQHAHIHWMTRGLFLGKRKIHLNPQVDDVQLSTELYLPSGQEFKCRIGDLEAHVAWQQDINGRLPAGSDFRLEMGHNGNGDIIAATDPEDESDEICVPDYAVDYDSPEDTPLEFQKPPGTGEDLWPAEFEEYGWSKECADLDDFAAWWLNKANLNAFAHVSHTFSHLELNNATYHDATREIAFNQAWLAQMEIDQATRFSPKGLIPPAITGLHNADVLQAWADNGLVYAVGDNTRPVLRSADSPFHPLITTVAGNGYAGFIVVPRYATTIYYNCDTAQCTLQEWIDTSAGAGDFDNLLRDARATNTRYLLGLQADPYMLHQANLRQTDMPSITVGSQTGKMSLLMAWVETITQEMVRLTDWPITSLKHDAVGDYFMDRMTLDGCQPQMSYAYSADGKAIDSVTVRTDGNSCSVPVPVTIPGGQASASGGQVSADQVGSEPTIYWVTMNGSPVTLSLSEAVNF